MPKRTKPDAMVISTPKQAVDAMKELKAVNREIAVINLTLDGEIDAAKKKAATISAPFIDRVNQLSTALINYGHHNKADIFKKKRSVETPFGEFGFRKSTVLQCLPKFKLAIVLEKLRDFGFTEAIKTKESVDKEAMREWPEERLASVGMKRVEKDTFYIELNQEEISEQA